MISLISVVVPCLYATCGLVAYCMLFYFHVATLVINATGVVFGKDLSEEDDIYLLSSEKKSKNIILESGKLSSELASTYLLWFTCFTIRSIYYLCGGCH